MAKDAIEFVWMDGELRPWAEATVHVTTHALHYGSSVFEGIRVYETHRGPAFFRLPEHLRRLVESGRIHGIGLPVSADALEHACHEVVAANGFGSAYLRPVLFKGAGALGVDSTKAPDQLVILALQWGAYLGAEGLEKGVDVCVSSWRRPAANTIPMMAKAAGNYLSSTLIVREARRLGFTEGIALTTEGFVSEGSGENLFLARDGVVYTPDLSCSILPGITRDTIMALLGDLGHEVRECRIPREMLYRADEIFFTGTAAEITPVRSVDRIPTAAAARGPIAKKLQDLFFGLFSGSTEDRRGWLQPLRVAARAAR